MKRLDGLVEELRDIVAGLDPAAMRGADAARCTRVAAEIERLGASAKLLFARRAAETGAWVHRTQATTAEQWLAEVSGTSEHSAREVLVTAERLESLTETEERLRTGALSVDQAVQVTRAATVNPDAEHLLLQTAAHNGMRTLRSTGERVLAAATDEAKAHETAVKERHLRTWTKGVATHGSFSGPTEQVNQLLTALKPLERQAFDEARLAGNHESTDAYRFDALVALAERSDTSPAIREKKSRRDVTRIRVDLPALLHGTTRAGEVCEIPGVGPVPVAHAREVLSHGLLELVITNGVDVQTVVSTTRHVPEPLKIAIQERDPTCKIRGCDRTDHLERHHTKEFAKNGLTTYQLLGNLCPDHHDRVTYDHFEIVVHEDGTWSLRAPPNEAAA